MNTKELNTEIKNKEMSLLEEEQQIQKKQLELNKTELETKIQVENTVDGDKKKVFKNETQRKVEVEKRLEIIPSYKELQAEVEKLKYEQKKGLIELGFLKREFRMHEIISRTGK